MRNDSISIANTLTILRNDINTNNTQLVNLNTRFINDSSKVADSLAAIRADLNGLNIVDYDPRITADSIRLEALKIKLIADSTSISNAVSTNASAITTNSTNISTNTTNISSNSTQITNLDTRFQADSANNADSLAAIRADLNGLNIVNYDPRITADSIRLEALKLKLIADSTSMSNAINTNASAIATNITNISTNTTNISSNSTQITNLDTRFQADSANNADSLAAIRTDLNGLNIVNYDPRITADSIRLENLALRHFNDSVSKAGAISTNANAIFVNGNNIATNTTNISNNTQRIIDSVSSLSTNLLARINADSLLRFINDTTIRGQLRDTSATLRALINSSNTDDQQISFSISGDTIVLEDGGILDIKDIRDSLTNYNSRIVANQGAINSNTSAIIINASDIATNSSDIATNTTDIATNTSGISSNTTNIANNTSNILDLDTRFQADSTSNADSLAAIRADLNGLNIVDYDPRITADSIRLEALKIKLIADSTSISNAVSTNASAIATNSTNISTNTTNIATNITDIANLTTQVNLIDSTKIQFGTTAVTIPIVNDAISFQTNGSTALTIDQNQRSIFSDLVGIATPTPTAFLGIRSNNEGIPSANFNTIGGDAPAEGLIMTTNGVANDAYGIFSRTFGGSNSIGIRTLSNSSSSVLSDSSIALYARASGINNNTYSGFFDRGNVFIRDTLILPTGANSGYIMTSDANGFATWQLPAPSGNVNTAGGNTINRLAYWNSADSITFFNDVFIDTVNDRIGIGTTAPSQKLQVNGGIRVSAGFNANNGTQGAPAFRFESDPNTGMFNAGADQLGFTIGGSEALRIISSGNIGIGTTIPDSMLEVNGGVKVGALNVNGSYTFPVSDGIGEQFLQTDGSGNVSWSSTLPSTNCPAGMTNVNGNICIETNERAASDWYDAASTCASIGYKLPSWAEWYGAVSNAVLTNETNNWEWVSDGTSNTARKVGNGDIKATANDDPELGSASFRCIFYK